VFKVVLALTKVVFRGATNSNNSCVFDVFFELFWWCTKNHTLGTNDFSEKDDCMNLFLNDHRTTSESNAARNNFRTAIGHHWDRYRVYWYLTPTIASHLNGTDRIGIGDIISVLRDYVFKPAVFSTIYKTGCCLNKIDERWGKSRQVPFHAQYNHKTIKQSIEQDLLFNAKCSCGIKEQINIFPKFFVIRVPQHKNWEEEYEFDVDIYNYRLISIIYFNDTGRLEDSAANHFYICVLVCISFLSLS